MSNNFSLSFSQPLSVDSDMPKSCDTFTWLLPLLTRSTVFTLSHFTYDSTWRSTTVRMTAAVVTVRHALDAVHIQQQPGQHCIGLLHWTPAPFTACMFTIRLHPQSPCFWLGCYNLLQCTHVLTDCTSSESTNLKLVLPEKTGSMTSTAL